MRFLRSFFASCAVISVAALLCCTTVSVAQSTIVTYNPANPGLSTMPPDGDQPVQTGMELNKTALLNIPQAFVKPTIDGVFDPGEWSDAVQINLPTVVTAGNKAYIKVDACYMYIAVEMHGNPTYYGNANMANIWFDVNNNQTWDGINDPVLSLPAPGYLYPANVASYGYVGLGNWEYYTNRLRCHLPWYTLGVVPPESHIKVRAINVPPDLQYIEAQMDYVNGPIKLSGNSAFGMRIQTYSGYYTGGGTIQIQSQWPYVSTAEYFYGTYSTSLEPSVFPVVVGAGNTFDITDVRIADNPTFGSKAFVTGTTCTGEIDYVLVDPPPQTIDYRARFYGPFPSTALSQTVTGSVTVNNMSGTAQVTIPVNVPIGFYTIEFEADDPEVCGIEPRTSINNVLILGPGQIPCSVYPGDVNVDGLVNYGDKKDLWTYIHDANLNPSWLQGYYRLPPHYPEPLAEIEYIGQASIPWNTPEGCHMDTDGNGVVNSMDYIAIKVNWYKTHDVGGPKGREVYDQLTFDMQQNYPNPFNPETSIKYSVPEKSDVVLTVSDVLGNKVATLVSGAVEAGSHTVKFDGTGLASGHYIATVRMVGNETGLTYNNTVRMSLIK